MRKRSFLIIACLLTTGIASAADSTETWHKLYSYDELNSSLVINDFTFVNAQHGVAAGFLPREGR